MANVTVYNMEGNEVGTMELNDAIFGAKDHTVIFVMEPEIFPGWLKDRKESIKTISEIS